MLTCLMRRTATAEAVTLLCAGIKNHWQGWGAYLAQLDLFRANGVPT